MRLLAVVGPTASGKSDVCLDLAARANGEIVSCDSVQVYRGFEIGCAKPSRAERSRVPHHLLDVVDWSEPFDANRYRHLAEDAIAGIRARGHVPIVCGGTGLYLRILRWGLVDTPAADPALRARLEAEEEAEPGSLYARLRRDDPESARRIEPHNRVHIIRALEIAELTGEPASVVRGRHGFRTEETPMLLAALRWPAELLRARVEARARLMLEQGLLAEVRALLAAGVPPEARPMASVGYREACEVVRGDMPEAGLAERISRSTWAYAKRQMTWLRKERDVHWIDVRSIDEARRLVAALSRT